MAASGCPPPFLDAADYPLTGGQNNSRLCSNIGLGATCCLPCPLTDWVYPANFDAVSTGAEWVALVSVICCAFMLLSFVVLPVNRTSRHYLTVCLVVGIGILTLSFVVPLGAQPPQCYDAITPNDMHTNLACAFSGSFVLFGGMSSVMWVFLRSLSLHLQICWQITPGKKFFAFSLLGGWGVPVLILGVALALSGVSYRFGAICHINHQDSLGTFWGPVLAFAGLAAALQFVTFAYCIRVYLRSLMDPATTSVTSSHMPSSTLPSFQGSIKTVSTRAAYRRVRKVLSMQWRGIMVVILLLASATYFSIIFLTLDNTMVSTLQDPESVLPWVTCLLLNPTGRDVCLDKINDQVVGEAAVAGVLYLIASMGIWALLFLSRWSMVAGWGELFMRPFKREGDNWVSADARRLSDPRNYEMLTAPPQHYSLTKTPTGMVAKPTMPGMPEMPDATYSPSGMAKELEASPRAFSPPAQHPSPFEDPALPPAASRQRAGSANFSHPRPMRSASHGTTQRQYSRDNTNQNAATAASPLSAGSEFYTPRAFATPYAQHPGHASSVYSQHEQDYFSAHNNARRREAERERGGGSALGSRTGSALGNRSGSAMGGRDRPGINRSESVRSANSAWDWDPRSTFARGGPDVRGRDGALTPGGGR